MRMAEAAARMSLRDYVRDDDVDFAIKVEALVQCRVIYSFPPFLFIYQVMLESFLQAQKVSVRNSLQRAFRKYITFGEENNQLLMHQLQGLIRDAEKYHQVRAQPRLLRVLFLSSRRTLNTMKIHCRFVTESPLKP